MGHQTQSRPAESHPANQGENNAELTGWGRTASSLSTLLAPASDETWSAVWNQARTERGVTVRGAGRSYGDAALNTGGIVVRLDGGAQSCLLDPATGVMTAAAGTTLNHILQICVPQGWILPVLPGTAQVTVGGALASDVHGKNHLHRGSFSQHVLQATVRTPAQGVITVSPHVNAAQFWATAGGLGLTGVIEEVQFQLMPITSSWMLAQQTAIRTFDGVLAELESAALTHEHAVAWMDGFRTGTQFGAGTVTKADHLQAGQLSGHRSVDPLSYQSRRGWTLPARWNTRLVLEPLVLAANSFRLRRRTTGQNPLPRSIPEVLHPLDTLHGWNRLYGREGFIQYQCVVPHGNADTLARALRAVQSVRCSPTLVVIKRLGAESPSPLGFPMHGWTMAMDFRRRPELAKALNHVDALVVTAGGRVYLTKDSRLPPDMVKQMYPLIGRWQEICEELDPDSLMTSDLNRRLCLRRLPGHHR